MTQQFASEQPTHGETVLHCGHIEAKTHHWFALRGPNNETHMLTFNRPDGTTGQSSWVALCPKCVTRFHGSFDGLIRGDGIWQGDEAIITVPQVGN